MIRNLQKDKIRPNEKIGVFVCKCGHNIAEYVDVEEVVDTVKEHESVVFATFDEHTCSASGQQRIKEAIKEYDLDAVVVSACSPKVHEGTFQKCIKEGGLNEAMLSIANIREQVSWAHGHGKKTNTIPITDKAIDITLMWVERARFLSPLDERWTEVKQHAVVIGGGIAGIQSALDIANAGFKVTLIEREASIGGKMSMFNKVFPTNDCSACILTPKMNEVAENENIELLTLSEVIGFSGSIGDFTLTVRKKARYVTADCTFCDTCAQWCPIKIPDPFNINMKVKKAISRTFESAIPAQYYIEKEHCLKLMKDKCGACAIKCPVDAIKFDMQDEIVDIKAGVVVVATGFKPYIPVNGELSYLNYGKSENIITLLTAERLLSANGCSGGELWRPSDERIPNSIAFVLCVGSRDEQIDFNACSRACCMASIKNAALVKERYPDADVALFYIDIRAFGKGYEEAYVRAQDLGVRFIKARPAAVRIKPGSDNVIIEYEDFLTPLGMNPSRKEEFELAVYATGMRPAEGAIELGHMLGLSTDKYGFFMEGHPKLRPVESTMDGIYLAGTCQYPKDIPDTVAQASGAAMKCTNVLQAGKIKAEPAYAKIEKEFCSGCRSCETVCPYHAITMIEEEDKLYAEVNPNLCKACGLCSATCPTGIINAPGYTDEALYAQIQMAFVK
jgi:heterodisulfide reductase subunit A